MSGYRHCACRDCFEEIIGKEGDICGFCKEAACELESECKALDLKAEDDFDMYIHGHVD